MSRKQRFLITITVIFSLLSGLGYLGYFIFTSITDAADGVSSSRQDLALLLAKRKQATDISKEYDAIKDAVPSLDAALLHKNDSLSFIMLVENLAARSGVNHKIEAVVEDGGPDGKGSSAALFNLNLTGEFGNILKFIYLIENAKPYASLQTIQINAGAGASQNQSQGISENAVTVQTSIKVYTH